MHDLADAILSILSYLNPPTPINVTVAEGALFIRAAVCIAVAGAVAVMLAEIRPTAPASLVVSTVVGYVAAVGMPETWIVPIGTLYGTVSHLIDGLAVGATVRRFARRRRSSRAGIVGGIPSQVDALYAIVVLFAAWSGVRRFVYQLVGTRLGFLVPAALATIAALGLLIEPAVTSNWTRVLIAGLFPGGILLGLVME